MSIEAMKLALDYLDAPSSKVWAAGTQYKIITALRAAIEQAERQEPHGYLVHRNWKEPRFIGTDDLEGVPNLPFRNPEYTPLYTAPAQREWQGLTDEEIEDCMEMSIQKTCRAIEAKLKAKNA